jgi:hypothetical protein
MKILLIIISVVLGIALLFGYLLPCKSFLPLPKNGVIKM